MLVRWEYLLEEIRPYYPKAGRGRASYGLESMLRVHCVQLFYNLSDPATEDMLYEIESVGTYRLDTTGWKGYAGWVNG